METSMKLTLFAGVGLAVVALAAWGAQAQERFAMPQEGYLSLQGAYVMPRDRSLDNGLGLEFDDGLAARVALGSRMGLFRGEIEGGLSRASIDSLNFGLSTGASGRMDTWTAMANLYLDIDTPFAVRPYVGAGIGVAHHRARGIGPALGFARINDSDTVLGYQAMAGVSLELTPNFDLVAGYRFVQTERPRFSFDDGSSARLDRPRSHNVEAGVRFRF